MHRRRTSYSGRLERLFRQKYHVLKSGRPNCRAGYLKKQQDIPVIICDQRMPGMSGTEFYKQTLDFHQDGIEYFLTGYTDIDSLMDAINSGDLSLYHQTLGSHRSTKHRGQSSEKMVASQKVQQKTSNLKWPTRNSQL